MSNRSYLYEVLGRDEAEREGFLNNYHWLMKWCTPIFWYACFAPEDEVIVKDTYPAFMVKVSVLPERLSSRKEGVINLVPEPLRIDYSELYDRFSARLMEEFSQNILLDMSDFQSMMDYDEGSQELVRAEIRRFSEIFESPAADITLDDFPVASAYIGDGVAPADLEHAIPRKLAQHWRILASGESSKAPGFLHEPSLTEIEYAEQILAEQKAERAKKERIKTEHEQAPNTIETPKKPWWKFWGD